MSGIDEQIRDIPTCPLCNGVPSFWILYPTMARNGTDGWYWLFSDAYLERNTKHIKLTPKRGHRGKATLDDIVYVVCSDNNNHMFEIEHSLFQEVIRCARGLEENEWH